MNKDVMTHNTRMQTISGLELEKNTIKMEIQLCDNCHRLCPEDAPALLKHFNKKYSIKKRNLQDVKKSLLIEISQIDKAISGVERFISAKQNLLVVKPKR